MTRAPPFTPLVSALVGAGLVALSRTTPAPCLINETPSAPRGVYVRTGARVVAGSLVTVTPPDSARAYLASLGAPPDAQLLKRVAAGPGERVCRDGDRLTWPRGAVAALPRDRRGAALPAWRGCRRLGPDEVVVVGDSVASFDSRYFGPVRMGALGGVYKEVWRW